ncbi:hypothetical protein ACF061_28205 [Streptomyces sp. NPDC015220]|uniref:hypothetical protein n=1 Tax=Streptomyces sp. NPDC015220 TaxID=3364947 RepID=UPI0036F916C7
MIYHLVCWHISQARAGNTAANREAAKTERETAMAQREQLADAAAEASTRGYKPKAWRLGKSPGDYGQRSC